MKWVLFAIQVNEMNGMILIQNGYCVSRTIPLFIWEYLFTVECCSIFDAACGYEFVYIPYISFITHIV